MKPKRTDELTDREKIILVPYLTDVEAKVFSLKHLNPEVIGAPRLQATGSTEAMMRRVVHHVALRNLSSVSRSSKWKVTLSDVIKSARSASAARSCVRNQPIGRPIAAEVSLMTAIQRTTLAICTNRLIPRGVDCRTLTG